MTKLGQRLQAVVFHSCVYINVVEGGLQRRIEGLIRLVGRLFDMSLSSLPGSGYAWSRNSLVIDGDQRHPRHKGMGILKLMPTITKVAAITSSSLYR